MVKIKKFLLFVVILQFCMPNYCVNAAEKIVINGVEMVSVRELCEENGSTVYWNDKDKTIQIATNTSLIQCKINSNKLIIEKKGIIKTKYMTNNIIIDNGKTYVQKDALAEILLSTN